MFSGIAQMLLALGILILRYSRFANNQMAQINLRVFLAAAERAESRQRTEGQQPVSKHSVQSGSVCF